jgi:hypothetical protein
MSVCPPVCLSVCLSVCPPVCPSVRLSVRLSVWMTPGGCAWCDVQPLNEGVVLGGMPMRHAVAPSGAGRKQAIDAIAACVHADAAAAHALFKPRRRQPACSQAQFIQMARIHIGGSAVLFPKCMAIDRSCRQIDSYPIDPIQKLAMAFMFLMTEIPKLTQRGAREMSLHKVRAASNSSRENIPEVFAFLTKVLQDLHDDVTNPEIYDVREFDGFDGIRPVPQAIGLLLQVDLSHQGNRHAEVELRSLRMGFHQLLAMCRNLAEQIAYEATKATGEKSAPSLAEMKAANDAVLAQLTAFSKKVDQRVQELSAQPEHAVIMGRYTHLGV